MKFRLTIDSVQGKKNGDVMVSMTRSHKGHVTRDRKGLGQKTSYYSSGAHTLHVLFKAGGGISVTYPLEMKVRGMDRRVIGRWVRFAFAQGHASSTTPWGGPGRRGLSEIFDRRWEVTKKQKRERKKMRAQAKTIGFISMIEDNSVKNMIEIDDRQFLAAIEAGTGALRKASRR